MKASAVSEALKRQIRLIGLDIDCNGSHCLRHSYAVHLLRQGISVKTIGDVLGHRSQKSTCVYLRLAIDDLRDVALEVPDYPVEQIRPSIKALDDLPTGRHYQKAKPSIPLQSFFKEDITSYLRLHRSLGKKFITEEKTLHALDSFLAIQHPDVLELDGKIFSQWCNTLAHLTPTVKRSRMRMVRDLCLYRRRSHPHCFIPDISTFPKEHPQFLPYIFSQFHRLILPVCFALLNCLPPFRKLL